MSAQLFGKLPAHGDFIARGLTAAAREVLDGWLSASMAEAHGAMGASFADRFDRAMPWRCAGAGVAGAIAPSQDSVGRRFPLLLLAKGEGDHAEQCEELLYRAIGERWDADRLAASAGAAPEGPVESWFAGDGRRIDGESPVSLIAEMLA